MLTPIKGRGVVVTGASKGIGKGIARVFAHHGARVMVVARTTIAGEKAAAEIRAAGGDAIYHCCDVTDWDDVQAMITTAADRLGAVDVLCANAGIFPQVPIADMDPQEWDKVLGTNLKSSFLCVKAAFPHMKKAGRGRIVLTSSITGPVTGFPGWSHYGASKAGQLGFLRTAAIELARHGITINAVLPGNIATEGLLELGDAYMATMAAAVPVGRLGKVEDIGNAALFLASDEAAYITGQTIIVDGGQTLPESLEALAV